jgi:NAD(P)-dependent dehydrogenase (short-subunit alcohol dehydrogenase family)
MSFSGKVAAISGAGSGIGRELSLQLSRAGCHLAISDINPAALAAVAAECWQPSVTVTTQVLDVADRGAMLAWADQVVADHGQVNLIFNNAGVALGSTIEGMAFEDLEWIMGINFWGVVNGTLAFLPHLKASGDGHVINMSSVFGLAAMPGQSGYNAAKFAVRGFTESLRIELDMKRSPVTATSVHPGGIKTNIARASRMRNNMIGFMVTDLNQGISDFEKKFITTPARAAEIILKGVAAKKRRILVGPDAYVFDWIVRLFPSGYQAIVVRAAGRMMRKSGA